MAIEIAHIVVLVRFDIFLSCTSYLQLTIHSSKYLSVHSFMESKLREAKHHQHVVPYFVGGLTVFNRLTNLCFSLFTLESICSLFLVYSRTYL
jgi:hypothetical protein